MRIPDEVLAVLSAMEVSGNIVRFPAAMERLERKLYERTNAVLVELGGKWTRKAEGHVFSSDPAERLDAAIVSGEVSTAKETGFFPTPIALAKRLCELADVRPGQAALEPSAGTGRIVMALQRAGAKVVAVENNPERIGALLTVLGARDVLAEDFLALAAGRIPRSVQDGPGFLDPFDCVCMNPPFSRQQDIDHVRHALSFARIGGAVVSVMSAGVTFRQDRKATEFRQFVRDNDGTITALPDDSFAESGTKVRTVVVSMRKKLTVENVISEASR